MSNTIYVCTTLIPGLVTALKKHLPNLNFAEMSVDDLIDEERANKATEGWKGEILVGDHRNIAGLIWQPKEKLAFVQVRTSF
jgi:hypothetical protein